MSAHPVNFLRFALLMAGLLTQVCSVQGQSTELQFGLRRYVADVRIAGEKIIVSGVLFDLTDSVLVLAPIRGLKPVLGKLISQHDGTLPPTDSLALLLPLKTYRYAQVSRLTVHRRGHVGKGFLIGAGLGISIGLISGNDPPNQLFAISAPAKAVLFGILISLPGVLIGTAMTQTIKAGQPSIAGSAPGRFRKFTIVEQVKKATLYAP